MSTLSIAYYPPAMGQSSFERDATVSGLIRISITKLSACMQSVDNGSCKTPHKGRSGWFDHDDGVLLLLLKSFFSFIFFVCFHCYDWRLVGSHGYGATCPR